jgi:hypothetical protein
MDLSFLPDQNTEEDNKKFADSCYTKKQGMTINRLFNLIMEKHIDHLDYCYDLENQWFDREF